MQDSAKVEHAAQIIQCTDGRLLVVGEWQDSAWVKKVSTCGATIWEKHFAVGARVGLQAICELPNSNLAAVGTCRQCVAGDTASKAYLVLMDANANVLGDTMLGDFGLPAAGNDIAVLTSGHLAVTGYKRTDTLSQNTVAIAAILDANLTMVRDTNFNFGNQTVGLKLCATADSGFAIAGFRRDSTMEAKRGILLKCNALGDTVWTSLDPYASSQYDDVKQLADGRLVAVGTAMIDSIYVQQGNVRLLDGGSGLTITQQMMGFFGDDFLREVQLVEGGLLVAGRFGSPNMWNSGFQDWVMRMSFSLVCMEQWMKDEVGFDHELCSVLPLTADGKDWASLSCRKSPGHGDAIFRKHHQGGREINFTEFPRDFQLYPRDISDNGKVRIAGFDAPSGLQFDSLRVTVLRNDTLVQCQCCALDYGLGNASFTFEFQQPAICANYSYRATGVLAGALYDEAEACDVVAGDAYIITGQSNATANWFPDRQNGIAGAYGDHPNGFVRNFGLVNADDTVYAWRNESNADFPLADFAVGEWGLVLGDRIVDNYGVPIALLNGGQLGISIDDMQPNPANHADESRSYGKFLVRATKAGLKDRFKGLIFFQGETDAGTGYFHSTADELIRFDSLRTAWNVDFPGRQMNYLFQIRPGAYWMGATLGTCLAVEEAHRVIPDIYPDFQLMSTTGMNHDSTHYYYADGYERAGEDIFRLIACDVYGAPYAAGISPPNVAFAYFSNAAHTEITLEMREANDALTWFPGFEADFVLESSFGTRVIAGSTQGNKVILRIDQAPLPSCTGISFTSHPGGDACSVKNSNGIGMICFYNVPIAMVSVEEANATELDIWSYPNPAGERVSLNLRGEFQGMLHLRWLSSEGKQISTMEMDGDLGRLSLELPATSGLYLLEVHNGQGLRQTLRIIRQ